MDKPLADWLIPWLNRPGWQLLTVQWLVLAGAMLLVSTLLISGEWQQLERLHEQRQRLELQVAERHQQLSRLPASGELELRLQRKVTKRPDERKDFSSHLYQVGGVLLRWRHQDTPEQQKVRLRIEFEGLLRLLAEMSPARRIDHMKIEQQPAGLNIQLTLLVSAGGADE